MNYKYNYYYLHNGIEWRLLQPHTKKNPNKLDDKLMAERTMPDTLIINNVCSPNTKHTHTTFCLITHICSCVMIRIAPKQMLGNNIVENRLFLMMSV